ncbi:MAG: tRNA dihydrouridine(20/20a) synthase DusA [Betaproteobacteria bacterium]|nr:MAG: tRNA dihydrouridine(20/20a) synthase DusA [Betaproteobacteria bacterium]
MNNFAHRLCVAPMMDWTDRHCRYFLRLVSARSRLYTEMITTGALMFGNVPRHLDFDPAEHPMGLQLGGSDPQALAHCARLGEAWGYDEINLNVGCPSERVQTGSFGACLMADPVLVAECVRAIRDAIGLPVTVKHRIGIDAIEEYGFVRDFVGTVAEAGATAFLVHARNAILKGLSPKENREVPPLKYDYVHRLKRDFPNVTIVINGGIASHEVIAEELQHVDGVMLGRAGYHNPYLLAEAEAYAFGEPAHRRTRAEIVHALVPYVEAQLSQGVSLRAIARHVLGLYHGASGARAWRRILSDASQLDRGDPEVFLLALREVEPVAVPDTA